MKQHIQTVKNVSLNEYVQLKLLKSLNAEISSMQVANVSLKFHAQSSNMADNSLLEFHALNFSKILVNS